MRRTTDTSQTRTGREIARREWSAFCLQFTQDHQEWLVDVAPDDEGSRRAPQETRGLPFSPDSSLRSHRRNIIDHGAQERYLARTRLPKYSLSASHDDREEGSEREPVH